MPAGPPVGTNASVRCRGLHDVGPSSTAPSTAELSIDSHPQGALVTTAATPRERARPLGETPFVLRMPRGETPVTLVVSKRGFAPLSFKVVPNHDKDVATRLERGSGGAKLVASAQRRVLSANLPAGSPPLDWAARRPSR